MSGLAQRFRQAREAGNVSIDQAARATRIKTRYLLAIEDGDFAQLPDGPAGRGFIKNYARFLGIDQEDALLQFEAEFGIPVLQLREEVPPIPERVPMQSAYTRVTQPDLVWKGNLPDPDTVALDDDDALVDADATGTGITVPEISGIDGSSGKAVVMRPAPRLRAEGSSFRLGGRKPAIQNKRSGPTGRPRGYRIDKSIFPERSPLLPILGGAAALVLVAVIAFVAVPAINEAGWLTSASTATPAPNAALAPDTTPDAAVTPTSAGGFVAPRITIIAPAASIGGDAAATPEPNAPRTENVQVPAAPDGGFQLTLDAREQVFIKVIIDGSLVYQGVSSLGRNPTWSAGRSIIIETGNAGAFDVIVNGDRRGPPGAADERVRVTYSL